MNRYVCFYSYIYPHSRDTYVWLKFYIYIHRSVTIFICKSRNNNFKKKQLRAVRNEYKFMLIVGDDEHTVSRSCDACWSTMGNGDRSGNLSITPLGGSSFGLSLRLPKTRQTPWFYSAPVTVPAPCKVSLSIRCGDHCVRVAIAALYCSQTNKRL